MKGTISKLPKHDTEVGGYLASKKDGKTIIHEDGNQGGLLIGQRHNQGGIQMVNTSTKQPLEAETMEVVLTPEVSSSNKTYNLNGQTMTAKQIASSLNVQGGGVKFKRGGTVDKVQCSGKRYRFGGKIMTDKEIIEHISKDHIVDIRDGEPLTVGGGAIIITRGSVMSDELHDFNGKKMRPIEILSKINEDAGGLPFGLEDDKCDEIKIKTSGRKYQYGGDLVEDRQIVSSCGCNHNKIVQHASGGQVEDSDPEDLIRLLIEKGYTKDQINQLIFSIKNKDVIIAVPKSGKQVDIYDLYNIYKGQIPVDERMKDIPKNATTFVFLNHTKQIKERKENILSGKIIESDGDQWLFKKNSEYPLFEEAYQLGNLQRRKPEQNEKAADGYPDWIYYAKGDRAYKVSFYKDGKDYTVTVTAPSEETAIRKAKESMMWYGVPKGSEFSSISIDNQDEPERVDSNKEPIKSGQSNKINMESNNEGKDYSLVTSVEWEKRYPTNDKIYSLTITYDGDTRLYLLTLEDNDKYLFSNWINTDYFKKDASVGKYSRSDIKDEVIRLLSEANLDSIQIKTVKSTTLKNLIYKDKNMEQTFLLSDHNKSRSAIIPEPVSTFNNGHLKKEMANVGEFTINKKNFEVEYKKRIVFKGLSLTDSILWAKEQSNYPLGLTDIPGEVKQFMPLMQQRAIVGSREHWDILRKFVNIINNMPGPRETQSIKSKDKILYLHYFYAGSDWYIAEKDSEPEQLQDYGYTVLNSDDEMAEWGYVNIEELKESNKVELDFYFQPVAFNELMGKREGDSGKVGYESPFEFLNIISGQGFKENEDLAEAGISDLKNNINKDESGEHEVKYNENGLIKPEKIYILDGRFYRNYDDADEALSREIENPIQSDCPYKIIFTDGETLSGTIDLEPNSFWTEEATYKQRKHPFTWHICKFYGEVSAIPESEYKKRDYVYDKKFVDFAKKIITKYDIGQETQGILMEPATPVKLKPGNSDNISDALIRLVKTQANKMNYADFKFWFDEKFVLNNEDTGGAIVAILGLPQNASVSSIYNAVKEYNATTTIESSSVIDVPEVSPDPITKSNITAQTLVINDGTKITSKKQYEINNAVIALIKEKGPDRSKYSADDIALLKLWSGSGSLAKQGAKGTGLLDQFFTPPEIIAKMWGLAVKYGFNFKNANILEPAVGVGRFFANIPKDIPVNVTGYDIDETAVTICKVLYPDYNIKHGSFETMFFTGRRHIGLAGLREPFDIVITNPPYRPYVSQWSPLGEKEATG